MELNGKTAVVTGASGAIGSALTKELESFGITCIPVDKNLEFGCDFSNSTEVSKLAIHLSNKFPKIDFLFNVAGIGIYKNVSDLEIVEWENSFSINVTAPFIFSKYLVKCLSKSDNSMIFNIGSGMGVIPAKDRTAYCSSKFALRGFSLSLNKELKEKNIDVSLFTLGSIMTPFGTGGIDKRIELERQGKKYLTIDEVVQKITSIMKSENREAEYVMYPDGYM